MSRSVNFSFTLFVAGEAPNSVRAIANLGAFCRDYLMDRYAIVIVDVFLEPERALAEGIFMTPTLVAKTPPPVRRIVGTLSQLKTVLQALGLLDSSVT
jgi:circadian clock protein KaiB